MNMCLVARMMTTLVTHSNEHWSQGKRQKLLTWVNSHKSSRPLVTHCYAGVFSHSRCEVLPFQPRLLPLYLNPRSVVFSHPVKDFVPELQGFPLTSKGRQVRSSFSNMCTVISKSTLHLLCNRLHRNSHLTLLAVLIEITLCPLQYNPQQILVQVDWSVIELMEHENQWNFLVSPSVFFMSFGRRKLARVQVLQGNKSPKVRRSYIINIHKRWNWTDTQKVNLAPEGIFFAMTAVQFNLIRLTPFTQML